LPVGSRRATLGPKETQVLTDYIRAAMHRAIYDKLEDGTYFGEIPGFEGVWASAQTLEACRQELQEVLEDWLLLGLRLGHPLPIVEGIDLTVTQDVA
jgi:predicted RNase H-like HicB family nuclease